MPKEGKNVKNVSSCRSRRELTSVLRDMFGDVDDQERSGEERRGKVKMSESLRGPCINRFEVIASVMSR